MYYVLYIPTGDLIYSNGMSLCNRPPKGPVVGLLGYNLLSSSESKEILYRQLEYTFGRINNLNSFGYFYIFENSRYTTNKKAKIEEFEIIEIKE